MGVYAGEAVHFVGGLGAMNYAPSIKIVFCETNIGPEVPVVGETIHGSVSGATGVVVSFGGVFSGGGNWDQGDNLGQIVIKNPTGTWVAENVLDPDNNVIGSKSVGDATVFDIMGGATPVFLQNRGSNFAL